ncbi:flagellar basal body rod protein FlgC [Oceanibaculum pacificum]|uniref:Flagellar basal-body rod protein FlgC n=1 Tax=Oceanibaculum pacificum TaxID=580166 RepID=A0A154VBU9_9PROT|nr:flagellar basal body rod protein FlgC [Oceanibaculum pacificum]KZC98843.1 flagellar basal-body rod protein FlgC [Oceanibaculum pacificum]
MAQDLMNAMKISSSGMKAQGMRIRVASENLANADSVAGPGQDPYRRKIMTFSNVLDRANNVHLVQVNRVFNDTSQFEMQYDPSHPFADQDGYVMSPNVNTMVEMMDMREAQRSYEANLNVIESSMSMLTRTIDLLRS